MDQPEDHCPELGMAGPHQTYQLCQFLKEPADYRCLALPTGIANGHRRKAEALVTLEKQIQVVDLIIHDTKRSKVIFDLSLSKSLLNLV
jgi:hypothetical protein